MKYDFLSNELLGEVSSELRIGLLAAGLYHLADEDKHSTLVNAAVTGANDELRRLGVAEDHLVHVNVTGVLELSLAAKCLIESDQVDGVIAFGLVINGGIYRHEFVAQTSLDLLMRLQFETGVPVASCVLTPQTPKAPEAEFDLLSNHLPGKGKECARAIVHQIEQVRRLRAKHGS